MTIAHWLILFEGSFKSLVDIFQPLNAIQASVTTVTMWCIMSFQLPKNKCECFPFSFTVPGHHHTRLVTLESLYQSRYWRLNQSANCFMSRVHPTPSSIWSVDDHDLWPSCWVGVGVGVEAEDNIPPQKSMHINNAAAFSLMYVPVLMNYCVICCSGIHSTPGWLIQKPQNDAETRLLCSDPEHLWRRPWSESWVILHLLPEFMTHAGLQYPQNLTVQRHIYLQSVSWVSYWRQIEIESSASSADLSGIMCPFMRAVVECLGLFESLCCLIKYNKLCVLIHECDITVFWNLHLHWNSYVWDERHIVGSQPQMWICWVSQSQRDKSCWLCWSSDFSSCATSRSNISLSPSGWIDMFSQQPFCREITGRTRVSPMIGVMVPFHLDQTESGGCSNRALIHVKMAAMKKLHYYHHHQIKCFVWPAHWFYDHSCQPRLHLVFSGVSLQHANYRH